MDKTPKGMRLHIGIYGRRNAGKSSFLNALTGQQVAIVSEVAGTTTDPVEKTMELLPIGPVVLIDTAGLDDTGRLGGMRVDRTLKTLDKVEVAVLVAEGGNWDEFEEGLVRDFKERRIPVIVVFNKADLSVPGPGLTARLDAEMVPHIQTIATRQSGIVEFKEKLISVLPEDYLNSQPVVGDLVRKGDVVILVVPIDLEAPKGRIILPQVQVIRDLLDHDCCAMVIKEDELKSTIGNLKKKPALVVTDSQAFEKVSADTPRDVPLTSFSILFARHKGDLASFVEGARAIGDLKPGDKVLVAEACTHHPIGDDIGRTKIPAWLSRRAGGALDIKVTSGSDFPDDLSGYKLVVQCGSCTFNRKHVLSRVLKCREAGVPITNYGLAIAYCLGILDRAVEVFNTKITVPSPSRFQRIPR
ncbi:MAG: [FeFe] hydrogenase H-cluster maturation GTPase HydF [bacterium]